MFDANITEIVDCFKCFLRKKGDDETCIEKEKLVVHHQSQGRATQSHKQYLRFVKGGAESQEGAACPKILLLKADINLHEFSIKLFKCKAKLSSN